MALDVSRENACAQDMIAERKAATWNIDERGSIFLNYISVDGYDCFIIYGV